MRRQTTLRGSIGRGIGITLAVAGLIAVGLAAGCGGGGGGDGTPANLQATLTQIAAGLNKPSHVTSADDGTGRLFVTVKSGEIRIINTANQLVAEPFLDLSGIVNTTGEAGLLSVAFHPDYGQNGRVFVHFVSQRDGPRMSYVSEFHVSDDNPNRLDPDSEEVILQQEQTSYWHNGGLTMFGPDGYLWTGFGDGGSDTERDHSQDTTNFLGSLLRVDVDGGDPYAIPGDNPFVGQAGARDEIYAYGFRNPWRYSIDPATGRIFVGDVGESAWEEVNLVEAGGNFGWPIMEGPDCFPSGSGCDQSGLVVPIYEYAHSPDSDVCSITGGYVYRGDRYPQLRGKYFFGDYCTGRIWSLEQADGQWRATLELDSDLRITSFGLDADGEMYVVDFGGGVYRLDFEPQDNA